MAGGRQIWEQSFWHDARAALRARVALHAFIVSMRVTCPLALAAHFVWPPFTEGRRRRHSAHRRQRQRGWRHWDHPEAPGASAGMVRVCASPPTRAVPPVAALGVPSSQTPQAIGIPARCGQSVGPMGSPAFQRLHALAAPRPRSSRRRRGRAARATWLRCVTTCSGSARRRCRWCATWSSSTTTRTRWQRSTGGKSTVAETRHSRPLRRARIALGSAPSR
jgi:hypothetical protein